MKKLIAILLAASLLAALCACGVKTESTSAAPEKDVSEKTPEMTAANQATDAPAATDAPETPAVPTEGEPEGELAVLNGISVFVPAGMDGRQGSSFSEDDKNSCYISHQDDWMNWFQVSVALSIENCESNVSMTKEFNSDYNPFDVSVVCNGIEWKGVEYNYPALRGDVPVFQVYAEVDGVVYNVQCDGHSTADKLTQAVLGSICPAAEETAPETPEAAAESFDIETYASEIDSAQASDFTEADGITEYVRLTFRDYGELVIRLVPGEAPISVANFQDLVSKGFYNGLTFHRVYPGFMIQGGDPTGTGGGDSGTRIKGEFSANGVDNRLSHLRGVVSMARGSYSMDSASCQFFIVQQDSTFLDGQYAAFGYVVAGLETVDNVCSVELQDNGLGEVSSPVTPVVLESAVFVTRG